MYFFFFLNEGTYCKYYVYYIYYVLVITNAIQN